MPNRLMLPFVRLFAPLFCLGLLTASCGPSASSSDAGASSNDARLTRTPQKLDEAPQAPLAANGAAEPSAQAEAQVQGTVAGIPFSPTHAIFLQGTLQVPGMPKALVFVASDTPSMCTHLQNGTMPKGAQMIAMAAFYDAFGQPAVGQQYLPLASVDAEDDPSLHGFFRQLDDQCHVMSALGPVGAQATHGQATLTGFEARKSASLQFSLQASLDDGESLIGDATGTLHATFCDAPELFARAQQVFLQGVSAEGCR